MESTNPTNQDKTPTAAVIIIGDEILKGHTRDTNSYFLCNRLYKLGVQVKKISVIADDVQAIAAEVLDLSTDYTYVLTTGGVGPTHDDVTYAGIAEAFGDTLVENSKLIELYNNYYSQDEMTIACKMAVIPANAKIHFLTNKQSGKKYGYPVISMQNVYAFPGIPEYLEASFDCLSDIFCHADSQVSCVEMYFDEHEINVAPALNKAVELFQNKVTFGSYPEIGHSSYKVKLTLESDSEAQIRNAFVYLQEQLPSCSVVYYEKDVVAKAAKQVYGLVKHSAENSLRRSVRQAVEIIHECLEHYPLSDVCVSFNGGKDCTALLHLVYAVMRNSFPESTDPLQAMYIQSADPFPEVEEFIQQTASRYGLKLFELKGPIKDELQKLKDEHPNIRVMLMGSRRTDPFMSSLKHVQMTDPGWPSLLRISPLLDWSYEDVWKFLKQLCLPYCSLYDKGYTSLGSSRNTFPNPDLRHVTNDGKEYYKPAYTLQDPSSERDGRLQKRQTVAFTEMATKTGDPVAKQAHQTFSIFNLQSVCEQFEGIVQQTFGPNGQAGLIISSTGQPLLSTTGVELLRSVNFSDPVARIIVSAVSKHHEVTGDGSKEFILILVKLIQLSRKFGVNYSREGDPLRCVALKLARAFDELQKTVLPKMMSQINCNLLQSDLATTNWPIDKITRCLVTGFIAGKFGERVNQVLIELVLTLISKSCSEDGKNLNLMLDHMLDHFAVTCICVDSGPVSTSVVQEGVIVSRNFATLHRPCDQKAINFAIIMCDLNYLQAGDGVVYEVNSQNVTRAIQSNTIKVKEFVASYRSKNIQLILTNRTFSQVTLYLCNQNSISVIHSIEDDELERIVLLSGIKPISNPFDAVESCNILTASTIKPIVVGHHQWLRIIFPSSLPCIQVQHAIIRGPNQAVSKQYGFAIKNCLKCIRTWSQKSFTEEWSSDASNVKQITSNHSLIPVGGTWVFLLNQQLRLYCEEQFADEDMKVACQLLVKALLTVPRALLKNSWNGYRFRFVDVCHALEQTDSGVKCIDGLTGHVRNAADVNACEELHSKFVLLNNLLSLMRQLLRLDGILHVEKNIH